MIAVRVERGARSSLDDLVPWWRIQTPTTSRSSLGPVIDVDAAMWAANVLDSDTSMCHLGNLW